jgi:acyl-CoA hydrolase
VAKDRPGDREEKTTRMPVIKEETTERGRGRVAGRPPRESLVVKTEIVLPSDANNLGTVFGGRVMSWIDIAAAISAGRHCKTDVVTASMDDLHFHAPIKSGMVVVLNAQVNFAGRTSVEVGVEVLSEHPHTGERERCCQAWLTFVAVDGKGRPVEVPPLLPETAEERRRFLEAEERRRFRLDRRDRFR